VKIGGDIFLEDRLGSDGEIKLTGAEISGDLPVIGAKLGAFICNNLVVKGDLLRQRIENSRHTNLNLMGTKMKSLRDDKESWLGKGGSGSNDFHRRRAVVGKGFYFMSFSFFNSISVHPISSNNPFRSFGPYVFLG
jgi:hypothetical protein